MSQITFEELFADAAVDVPQSTRISARAAYQTVVADDVVLVDLRSPATQERDGSVHPRLGALTLTAADVVDASGPLVLLCGSGRESALLAEGLRRRGQDVRAVEGGYAGWRAAGMPTAPVRAAGR